MRFRTEYKIEERKRFVLDPRRPVALLGSCFADNISAKMSSCLWEAENPLGTLYNPLSIAGALEVCLGLRSGVSAGGGSGAVDGYGEGRDRGMSARLMSFEESLFESGGMWRSWLFDSKMSAETREDVVYAFGEKCRRLDALLSRAEVLFVTFGTAWCYYIGERLVANCHKQPAAMFERRRLSVGEIVATWQSIVGRLRECYPRLRVVFTVSPVRHLKDGFEGNARSKAILQLAVEEMCGGVSSGGRGGEVSQAVDECYYFPAYEIVNDDLRDYRFYASDLVHPSEEAVEYIWEKFKEMYIDDKGLQRLKEGEMICRGLSHRPLPNVTRCRSDESRLNEERRLTALRERLSRFEGERL
ncbi:MAG: GSCFA domain-containing protein [Bacteroides sp.]|nr:GSCFA domain-containing protein [Bacteroides sp.]